MISLTLAHQFRFQAGPAGFRRLSYEFSRTLPSLRATWFRLSHVKKVFQTILFRYCLVRRASCSSATRSWTRLRQTDPAPRDGGGSAAAVGLEGYCRYRDAVSAGELEVLAELSSADDSYLAYRSALTLARSPELTAAERLPHYLACSSCGSTTRWPALRTGSC